MTRLHLCKIRTTSFEREQGRYEVEGCGWSARERTIIARIKPYLKKKFSVKVRVEELDGLLGPGDVDVDFRRILKEARDERGQNCAQVMVDFEVVEEKVNVGITDLQERVEVPVRIGISIQQVARWPKRFSMARRSGLCS